MNEIARVEVEKRDANFFGTLSEEEVKAWKNLVPLHRLRAIDPMSFSDIYDPKSIKSDVEYVGRMEAKFAQDSKDGDPSGTRRGELLEAMIFEQLKYARWFGADADAVAVSRFDDIANGVDMIIQFIREGGFKFLALTIDITSSPDKMHEKLGKIKASILSGSLTMIKYFDPNPKSKKADGSNFSGLKIRGELRDIPRVVVGIDRRSLQELSLLKISLSGALKGSRDISNSRETRIALEAKYKEAVRSILNHRIQLLILEQIKLQLAAFSRFAREHDQERLAQQYDSNLLIINEVLGKKLRTVKITPEEIIANNNDEVLASLHSGLKAFS